MSTFPNTLFHLHAYPPMKMEQNAPKRRHMKFRRPGNYPEESTQQLLEYCFLEVTCAIYTSVVCLCEPHTACYPRCGIPVV